MGWPLPWYAVGAAGAFLAAAVLAVALDGPGWPYFLILGAACLLGALLSTLLRRSGQGDTFDGDPVEDDD